MIFDTLENLPKYAHLLDAMEEVERCLRTENLAEKPVGSYTTGDERCRYNIVEYETAAEGKLFEKHRLDTDIQVMLTGSEKMEFTTDALCGSYGDYNEKKDVAFADGKSLLSLNASSRFFVLFFAGEPHKPGLPVLSSEKVKKVIFKVRK